MTELLESLQLELRSPDRLKAIEAVKKLTRTVKEDSAPALISCFSNPHWLVRRLASDALASLGRSAVSALHSSIDHPNDDVRVWVVQTLGKINLPESGGVLSNKLQSEESDDVKLAISVALGHLGDNGGIHFLIANLSSADFEIRKKSAEGLADIGASTIPFLIESLKSDNEDMVYWTHVVLKKLKLPAPHDLIRAFPGEPPVKRMIIADILGEYRGPEVMECLVQGFKDPVWTVRRQASESLVKMGDSVLQRMAGCVEDPDPDVRYWGLKTLGKIPGSGSEILCHCLSHQDREVRLFSAEYLTLSSKEVKYIEKLMERLGDTSLAVREAAVNSLLRIGDEVVGPLQQALKHKDQLVAFHATKALGRLGEKARGPLLEALNSENPLKRKWAATALGELKMASLAGPLIMALGDKHWSVRFVAAASLEKLGGSILDELIQNIQNANPDISYWVLRVLKKLKNEIIERLLEILRLGNEDMRFFTAFALGELDDSRAVAPLSQALHDGSDWVRKLAMESLIKLGALDELKKKQESALPALKKEIALELRKLGIVDAEPALTRLRSLDPAVAQEAAKELIEMGEIISKRLNDALEAEPDESIRMWLIKIIRAIQTGSEFGLGF